MIGIVSILSFIVLLIIPIGIALHLNKKFQQEYPNFLPYRWGYFNAVVTGFYTLFGFAAAVYMLFSGTALVAGFGSFFVLFITVFTGFAAYFLYHRYKWIWVVILVFHGFSVVGSLFSGELIVALIQGLIFAFNVYYVNQRWGQLKPSDEDGKENYDKVFD